MKKYREFLIDDSLPSEAKKEITTVASLFKVLEKKKNYIVDPLQGKIVLLVKKVELNEILEKEVKIKLNFVGEEEQMEKKGRGDGK